MCLHFMMEFLIEYCGYFPITVTESTVRGMPYSEEGLLKSNEAYSSAEVCLSRWEVIY